jgi:hypothetical protein
MIEQLLHWVSHKQALPPKNLVDLTFLIRRKQLIGFVFEFFYQLAEDELGTSSCDFSVIKVEYWRLRLIFFANTSSRFIIIFFFANIDFFVLIKTVLKLGHVEEC